LLDDSSSIYTVYTHSNIVDLYLEILVVKFSFQLFCSLLEFVAFHPLYIL